MPDAAQENAFVEAFIKEERRERYKSLLTNPKKRRKMLERLNHVLDFMPSLASRIPGNQHTAEGIASLLRARGMQDTDTVYIFSDVKELDGVNLPLRQALKAVLDAQFGSVVCCAPGRLAYYRPEAPANGYVLEQTYSQKTKTTGPLNS